MWVGLRPVTVLLRTSLRLDSEMLHRPGSLGLLYSPDGNAVGVQLLQAYQIFEKHEDACTIVSLHGRTLH